MQDFPEKMLDSQQIWFFVDYPTLCFWFGGSLRKRLQFDRLFKQDKNRAAKMLDEDEYQNLDIVQRPRTDPPSEYDEAILPNRVGPGRSNQYTERQH